MSTLHRAQRLLEAEQHQALVEIAEQEARSISDLVAPVLLEYEIAAILRKAVVAQWLTTDLALEAVGEILALNVRCVAPTAYLHQRALRWAYRLGHSKAYDAHYLALAEQEGIELWTADRRLADGAQQAGVHWVHWIGQARSLSVPIWSLLGARQLGIP